MGLAVSFLAAAAIGFSHHAGHLVVQAPGYRVLLSDRTGRILEVDDARGRKLLGSGYGCMWWLNPDHHATTVGGCSIRPRARWDARTSTLTLRYGSLVAVTLHAQRTFFDLRLTLRNNGAVRDQIRFPAGLAGDTRTVQAGYAPDVLPGVKLLPAFFSRVGNPIQIYPSRWSFADWLALDTNGGHVALYSVNRGPIAPLRLGFLHLGAGAPCSQLVYCVLHQFETWVEPQKTWSSPIVRVRVGESAQQAILDYRRDNGIDAYPSLAEKLGPQLSLFARAPLIKADVSKLQLPFAKWAPSLQRLPSPVLLHPVAYERGGHDENDPDFLPPDPAWGTTVDLANVIAQAHARGDAVMPYDNLSWWDPTSPTMQATTQDGVAVLDSSGAPETIEYGDHFGTIVSPWSSVVRQRAAQELDAWRSLGADCVFLDQIGARPWLRDFNAASPTPVAYDDGWLSLLAPYRSRCLMAEDGWDRLARDFVGFHGGLLMMQRELAAVDRYFGEGNWEPYPLATWLFHDKVLMYQHDLYDLSLAIDGEVLTWNAAFGLAESYEWKLGNEQSPWLVLAARLQQALGPHSAGVPLASYTTLAPGVTRSVFGDLTVDANVSSDPYEGIDADGFHASTADGSVDVRTYPGGHWVIDDHGVVRQPVGGTLQVTVPGTATRVVAADGSSVPFSTAGGATTFTYVSGVESYRVVTGPS
jgi:Domain of unknown function (DUF6259)